MAKEHHCSIYQFSCYKRHNPFKIRKIRRNYDWHSLCDGTCQPAYECLYESLSYEEAIRNCMAIGGDCDTTGAICGGIAEAVWGVPADIEKKARTYLDKHQLGLIDEFREKYCKTN